MGGRREEGVRVELWKRKLFYSMVAKTTDHEYCVCVCPYRM